jgi:hypothetical protein
MIEHTFDTETPGSRSPCLAVDALEQIGIRAEAGVGRLRAAQVVALRGLDVAQIASADGARSLAEWVAARLDVSHATARMLVLAARSMPDRILADLAEGTIGFERAAAETRLHLAGVDDERREASRRLDLGGVRRLVARHRRLDPPTEQQAFAAQYVVIQPELDESSWRLHGRLAGFEGRVVEEALHRRMDALSDPGDRPLPSNFRSALALVSVCQDSLGTVDAGSASEPVVTVMVDAALAAASGGEAGAEIVSGPRVGPGLLAELLCTGRIEVNLTRADGTVLGLGDLASAIPPRLRRHVLARDGGCTVAGCRSRYRLQVHHLVERSRGGSHHPDNLTTLCWAHHHVAVHGLGFRVDPASPPGRRRLLPPHRPRAPG